MGFAEKYWKRRSTKLGPPLDRLQMLVQSGYQPDFSGGFSGEPVGAIWLGQRDVGVTATSITISVRCSCSSMRGCSALGVDAGPQGFRRCARVVSSKP
jgi:hypothetical protein